MPKKKVSLHAKDQRQSERRRQYNTSVESKVKTAVKKARAAVESAPQEAADVVRSAYSTLDKAASKGVIHKRNAMRKKSRLTRQLNKALNKTTAEAS